MGWKGPVMHVQFVDVSRAPQNRNPETELVVAVETGFTYRHTRRGLRALAYRGPTGPF